MPGIANCLQNAFGGLILFGIGICSLSGIGLWAYNAVTDQYPTGFAGGWFALAGAFWGIVTFRHYRQKVSDKPALPAPFVVAFGCYYILSAICMFIAFISLAISDALGTSVWPAICVAYCVVLAVVWCRKELKRHEFDEFDAPDDSACSSIPLNVGLVVGCLVLLFFQALMAAQAAGAAADVLSLSPPGRLFDVVDVGTESLDSMHIHCLEGPDSDAGLPTVLFESAINSPGVGWTEVQRRVALVTKACYYDRKGYGWSWRGSNPRHVNRFAVELHDLLQAAKVSRPLVYVGWGYGSFAALAYAAQFGYDTVKGNHTDAGSRPEVAGIVFVDGLHRDSKPSADGDVAAFVDDTFGLDDGEGGPTTWDQLTRFLVPVGFIRVGERANLETGSLGFPFGALATFPQAAFDQFRAFLLGYYHSNVVVQEKREWQRQSLQDVANMWAPGVLGDLPVSAVSRKSTDPAYTSVQNALASLSASSGSVVVSNATSYLPFNAPGQIAEEIVRVLAQAYVKYSPDAAKKRDALESKLLSKLASSL